MIGVKVTIECGDCGTKTVFTDPDMYSLLEETVFYSDCIGYDEENGFKEYCTVYGKDAQREYLRNVKNKEKK